VTTGASPLLPGRSDHVAASRQSTSAARCLTISLGATDLIPTGLPSSAESPPRINTPEQPIFFVTPLPNLLSPFTQ
jgi:hypothetical protein